MSRTGTPRDGAGSAPEETPGAGTPARARKAAAPAPPRRRKAAAPAEPATPAATGTARTRRAAPAPAPAATTPKTPALATADTTPPAPAERAPAASPPAARAEHATKVYGRADTAVTALDDVSVDFERGRFTVIMGPSGSGKSTLMHCVAGLDTLTGGRVLIGETDLTSLDDKRLTTLRRDKIGFVFQAFNLVPTLTALENITLPMALAGRDPDRVWLDTVVDTVKLRDRLTHRPSELSGGQQQRVAVARALAARPEIVFADEPTGNLDSRSGAEILGFMRYAVDELGQTIVMVTHDPVAAAYGDRVVFLADGRVVDDLADPTADTVLDRMKNLEA